MKKIILIVLAISLTSCFEKNNKVVRVKVLDKSTYSYNINNTPKQQKINKPKVKPNIEKPINYNAKWISPINTKILKPYNNKNKVVVYNSRANMPIVAINEGKVVYSSGNLKSFGNMIIIKHPYGFYSHYMFNDKLLVSVGDLVAKGDKIATTSNKKFGLQLKKYTTIINPTQYIK